MNIENFDNILNEVSAVITGNAINAGRDRTAIISGSNVAQYSAILDVSTCKLCKALDQKYFKVGSKEYLKYTPRIHQNCRCIWVYVGIDELNQPEPNFKEPPKDLLKYGSLISDTVTTASILATSINISALTGYSLLKKETIDNIISEKKNKILITGDTIIKTSITGKDLKVNDNIYIKEITNSGNLGIIINGRKKKPFELDIINGKIFLNKNIKIISGKEKGDIIGIIEKGG